MPRGSGARARSLTCSAAPCPDSEAAARGSALDPAAESRGSREAAESFSLRRPRSPYSAGFPRPPPRRCASSAAATAPFSLWGRVAAALQRAPRPSPLGKLHFFCRHRPPCPVGRRRKPESIAGCAWETAGATSPGGGASLPAALKTRAHEATRGILQQQGRSRSSFSVHLTGKESRDGLQPGEAVAPTQV